MRFELTAEEIAEALQEESGEVAAPEDIPVPDALLPAAEVEVLVAQRPPAYVPIDGSEVVRSCCSDACILGQDAAESSTARTLCSDNGWSQLRNPMPREVCTMHIKLAGPHCRSSA